LALLQGSTAGTEVPSGEGGVFAVGIPLFLWIPLAGFCGRDVTREMQDLVQEVHTELTRNFQLGALSLTGQDVSLWATKQSMRHPGKGWDIDQLHHTAILADNYEDASNGCGLTCQPKGLCRETVTVNGKCYLAEHVNYFLWGFVHRFFADREMAVVEKIGQIHIPTADELNDVAGLPELWGDVTADTGGKGRGAWAKAGYRRELNAPEAVVGVCLPCPSQWVGGRFTWHVGVGPLRIPK
jgi:hypothetical protein